MNTTPEGFSVEELVPPEVFELVGDLAIRLFDPSALLVLEQLRKDYGTTYVNSWDSGGEHRYRGLRPLNCPVGAKNSRHKAGDGFDCTFKNHDTEKARREVIAKAKAGHPVYGLIGAIELGTSWLHFDTRPRVNGKLLEFKP